MDSSFLTWVNVGLGLFSLISFLKLIIQFGLPNHPLRFSAYLVSICVTGFFVLLALTDLALISPLTYLRWKNLPLLIASHGLLIQAITTMGQFSLLQQKIFSRFPLILALVVFAFFNDYAEWIMCFAVGLATLFLTISVGKARYQKRAFFKMVLFLGIYGILTRLKLYWPYVIGEVFLYFVLFYFYLFQQTFGVMSMIDRYQESQEGERA